MKIIRKMTREEIKNTPELVDFMLDKSVIADSREKLRKRLEEICNLAIKALEQELNDEKELIKGHCICCKHFERDVVAKVDGIPLIVAHEMCNKWGNGCKTKEDGYCFLFEPIEN